MAGHVGMALAKQGQHSEAIPLLWDTADVLKEDEECRNVQIRILKQLAKLDRTVGIFGARFETDERTLS